MAAWSWSVFRLSSYNDHLTNANFEETSDIVNTLGKSALNIKCNEGDEYLIYVMHVWPWRQIIIFNVVDNYVLIKSPAKDLHTVMEEVTHRTPRERELASITVQYFRTKKRSGQP
jgi:hypothetical protein